LLIWDERNFCPIGGIFLEQKIRDNPWKHPFRGLPVNILRAITLLALSLAAVFVLRLRSASAVPRRPSAVVASVDSRADLCRTTLKRIQQNQGLWRSYDEDQNFGTVVVDPAYRTSSQREKEEINRLIRCVLTHGRGDESVNLIEYVDSASHKAVAYWSPYEGLETK
jgi:hypothetical protein